MNTTILFLYSDGNGCIRSGGDNDKTIEENIKYWLDKSPGIHPIDQILVMPDSEMKDWTWVIAKKAKEERKYEAQKQEEWERAELERLKQKFG